MLWWNIKIVVYNGSLGCIYIAVCNLCNTSHYYTGSLLYIFCRSYINLHKLKAIYLYVSFVSHLVIGLSVDFTIICTLCVLLHRMYRWWAKVWIGRSHFWLQFCSLYLRKPSSLLWRASSIQSRFEPQTCRHQAMRVPNKHSLPPPKKKKRK